MRYNIVSIFYFNVNYIRVEHKLLVGYTIIAFNQVVQKKIDPKKHTNAIDPLLAHLRKRTGIAYLKRLTIVLDEDSEKGFGLVRVN